MASKPEWDVVVVGAGVGGMALAMRLARQGYRVAIVEPTQPGTFRVGESLDWEAPIFLRRLGFCLDSWVKAEKATYKRGAVASAATQVGVEVAIGFAPIYRFLQALVGRNMPTLHIDREKIDVDFATAVREAGADWIVGKATAIERQDERVTSVILSDGRCLSARFFVDSSGKTALFRKQFGIDHDALGERKVAIRARFPHSYDHRGTRIRTDDTLAHPAWVWDIHVAPQVTDIGVVLHAQDCKQLRQRFATLGELFVYQTSKHPDLQWLTPLVTETTELWTCSFQNLVAHRSCGDNWLILGEAAFIVDPILSSGYTTALRSGFFASNIIAAALSRNSNDLCRKKCRIYHEKTAAQVTTVNRLIDILWDRGRLRDYYSLRLNILAILIFNFNLNHLHTRYVPRTIFGLRLLQGLHRFIDALVPAGNALLTTWGRS